MTAEFLNGASVMACAVIAVFFYRFWRSSGDRLFGIFALAFAVFGVNRIVLSVVDEHADGRVYVYLVRLLAFLLIIAAIVDKNRPRPQPPAAVAAPARELPEQP